MRQGRKKYQAYTTPRWDDSSDPNEDGQLYCSFVRSRAPFDALFHLKITEIKFHKRVAKRSQQAWSEAKRAALVTASNRRKKVSFPILYTNAAETLLA